MGTIALITDFGEADPYVGIMKGVISTIAPEASLVDISHNVNSFNIKSAAFLLQKSVRYFPEGTIFLVVVDPGVGSDRKIISAQAGGYTFIAPDNGVLSYLLTDYEDKKIVSVENSDYFLEDCSNTFHGRDIMAPVAAHLHQGVSFEQLGKVQNSYCVLKMSELLKYSDRVIGEVVYIDKFGNMISNITKKDLPLNSKAENWKCKVGDLDNIKFVKSYNDGHGLSLTVSSFNTVEAFINKGNAAKQFSKPLGTIIVVES